MIARRFSALILRASGLHVAYIPGFHAKTVQLCNIANNQSPTTAALQRTITRDLWGLRFSPPTQESAKATVQVSHAHHEAEENTTHTKSNKESDLPVPFADVKVSMANSSKKTYNKMLGSFPTAEEAARMADIANYLLDRPVLNFPHEDYRQHPLVEQIRNTSTRSSTDQHLALQLRLLITKQQAESKEEHLYGLRERPCAEEGQNRYAIRWGRLGKQHSINLPWTVDSKTAVAIRQWVQQQLEVDQDLSHASSVLPWQPPPVIEAAASQNHGSYSERLLALQAAFRQWAKMEQRHSSIYQGVFYNSKAGHWFSRLRFRGCDRRLGHFATEEDAYRLRCIALLLCPKPLHPSMQQQLLDAQKRFGNDPLYISLRDTVPEGDVTAIAKALQKEATILREAHGGLREEAPAQ